MRRAKPGGWFDDFRYRIHFEGGARKAFPSMRNSRTGKGIKSGVVVYTLTVPVPEFEARTIKITLMNWKRPVVQSVTADGRTASPHRYSDGRLCLEFPDDETDRKWQPDEGLLGLVRCAQVHLFKEAYWRRYGEWPGEEAPHGEGESKEAA
jgi:hypothetical protein